METKNYNRYNSKFYGVNILPFELSGEKEILIHLKDLESALLPKKLVKLATNTLFSIYNDIVISKESIKVNCQIDLNESDFIFKLEFLGAGSSLYIKELKQSIDLLNNSTVNELIGQVRNSLKYSKINVDNGSVIDHLSKYIRYCDSVLEYKFVDGIEVSRLALILNFS